MALATPDFVRPLLIDFEKTEGFLEVAITDALRKATDAYTFQNQEERDAWWAESAAFSFSLRTNGGESAWNTSYGPLFTATKDNGDPFYAPDISQADAETVRYWEMRSADAKHPVLVARYADLVWDFTKLVTGAKPSVEAAQRAIDSYVGAARLQYKIAVQPIRYLSRALDLALSIGDKGRLSKVIEAMFELYERVATPGRAGSWVFLFDTLYGNRKVGLSADQENAIIQKLEQMLARSADRAAPEGFDPWGAQAAAERLGQCYRQANKADEAKRVTGVSCRAFEKIAEEASPLLAMGWLQPVYETYLNAGMRDDATRVQLALKEKGQHVHEDMKHFSAKIEIPTEEMEKFIDEITAGGLELALRKIAVNFTTRTAQARDLLKEIAAQAPLQATIGIQKIADAQIIAQVGSVQNDPEGRIIWQLAQLIELESGFLIEALRRVRERYSPTAEQLTTFLYRSPVFDESQRSLMTEAIDAYLKEDMVKAIHVLVPQIENSLRHLLTLMGVPTNKPMRGPKGVMQEKNLNDILTDPAIQASMDEDTINYLQTFLNDPRGQNVRNRVSHGLCRREFFGRLIADRVFHMLLSISRLARTNSEASAVKEGTA